MKGLQRLGGSVASGRVRASHHLAFQAWLAMVRECKVKLLLLEVEAFDRVPAYHILEGGCAKVAHAAMPKSLTSLQAPFPLP
jgi:hypothetical protein